MNVKNLQYSLKNIPIPKDNAYLKSLIDKTEHFIKRIRWKAFFYDRDNPVRDPDATEVDDSEPEDDGSETSSSDEEELHRNFGFKSPRTPPWNRLLKPFEDDLYTLIHNIKFSRHANDFQQKLKSDARLISSSDRLLVAADKSTNLYEMNRPDYERLLHNNITQSYRKSNTDLKADIDSEAKEIAVSLSLEDRIQGMSKKEAFITLKDHKDNFQNSKPCRLINPSKSEIGHISKVILEKAVKDVTKATGLNQWRNTSTVIDWFRKIPRKSQARLIKFDICDFYPSISEELLLKAIEFARRFTRITEEDANIIMHARKCLLFNKDDQWIKKDGNGLFDVTMGSWDGAEICELVGLYLLNRLQDVLPSCNVGLYRDDGLAFLRSRSGRRFDKLRKDIIELFRREGLSITCDTNLIVTDYLDITLNMETGKYQPFRKENNKPLYINAKSNHPSNIKNEIPNMIQNRISDLSCDEEAFNRAKGLYESALRDSGFPSDLQYQHRAEEENTPARRTRKRNRKVVWYNPPFSEHVKTDIGRKFLNLLDQHFPTGHRYAGLFNRSKVKVSYSCMTNMETLIKSHNKNILKPQQREPDAGCNCQDPASCPLNGNCLVGSLTYSALVTARNREQMYYGSTGGQFKKRFYKHQSDFRHRSQRKATELSKLIWQLKDDNIPYTIKWDVVARSQPYVAGSKKCDVCLTEKMIIARSSHPGMINSRSEILSKCRHMNKFLLKSI